LVRVAKTAVLVAAGQLETLSKTEERIGGKGKYELESWNT
jgi:hypothetical protein